MRSRTETAGNWPGYNAGPPPARKDRSRPVRADVPPVPTGISLTEAEKAGALHGFAGKSEWVLAGECFIPFGKHKGRQIHALAQASDGLAYLDWLLKAQSKNERVHKTRFDLALITYMKDERVTRALAALGS